MHTALTNMGSKGEDMGQFGIHRFESEELIGAQELEKFNHSLGFNVLFPSAISWHI